MKKEKWKPNHSKSSFPRSYEIVYAWIVNSTRNNNWILDERNVLEENRLLQVIRNPGRARFNEVTRGYNADP